MNTKLQQLLQVCWSSPLFGDAYVSPMTYDTFQQKMQTVYERFVAAFRPILIQGMPDTSSADIDELISQIAPKTVALCSAVAAEIDDITRLTAATVCFGLIYWADGAMDRGDDAMAEAISFLGVEHEMQCSATHEECAPAPRGQQHALQYAVERLPAVPAESVQIRLAALSQVEHYIACLSRPEDAPFLMQAAIVTTLRHGLATRALSHQYLHTAASDFWSTYADTYVFHTITNIQLTSITAVLYALYRHEYPELPTVSDVFDDPALQAVLVGPANAALRIFDDVGDQDIDLGETAWNRFHLNIFNHSDLRSIRAFLRFADITDESIVETAIAAFQSNSQEGDACIVRIFADLIRNRIAALPTQTWSRYDLFLVLTKRFIESGYVNVIGDIALAESQRPNGATDAIPSYDPTGAV
jgi:hypothetical protein